ncbi:unnamed protein product [Orchesella dallaii]|uniref:Thyrotropin-releasing hormone receptor n=1 Tax=Orchesella dallaii TaxID=48710 RepID=A0ABP1S112_9HEXA
MNSSVSPPFWEEDPKFFPISYRIGGTIVFGIIFSIGCVGNLLVVFVVTRSNSMWTPTNCYLVSLAVADCIVLVAAVPQEIVSYYLPGSEWIWGDIGCVLSVFLQNLGINASSLCVAAFTVERYIGICKPFLAQTMCTCARALKIVMCVWIFAILYSSPWLFLTATFPIIYRGYPPLKMCDHKLSREEYLGYYFTDLVLFYLIPLLLCIFLYSKICQCLVTQPFTGSPSPTPARLGHEGNLECQSNHRTSSRTQVVKMLAIVSALFAILWLPYRGMLVYNSVAEEKFMNVWYLMGAKGCIYLNSAINPILYNAMSVKFRKEFRRALFLRNGPGETVGKLQLIHWYFQAGYHCLVVPFKISRSNDGMHWETKTFKFQLVFCILGVCLLEWIFIFTGLTHHLLKFWDTDKYEPKLYFRLAYHILDLISQFQFVWIIFTKRTQLECLFNQLSSWKTLNQNEKKSSCFKWKWNGMKVYMALLHVALFAPVVLKNVFFIAEIGSLVRPSEQQDTAIKIGRWRFFIDEQHNITENFSVFSTIEEFEAVEYSAENVVIGIIELVLEFARLWSDCWVGAFFYGSLTYTFWSSAKDFETSFLEVSENVESIKESGVNDADEIVKKYFELKKLSGLLNPIWSTPTFMWFLEMVLRMVIRLNNAVRSDNVIFVSYITVNTTFLVIFLILLAEGYRIKVCFKESLARKSTRFLVFANRETQLKLLERDLDVGAFGIGSPGFYQISYGFLADLLVFTVSVFLISF